MTFSWWEVRAKFLPRETVEDPAGLASRLLEALEERQREPYTRGAAVAAVDGALDVQVDVIAESAASSLAQVNRVVEAVVGGRMFVGGARLSSRMYE